MNRGRLFTTLRSLRPHDQQFFADFAYSNIGMNMRIDSFRALSIGFLSVTLLYILQKTFRWALDPTKQVKEHGLPFPPGPTPLPVIGNLLDMPLKQPWNVFTEWARQYGEIVHVSVMGQRIIILNSAKVANDLFEKRSAIYSDRPRLPLLSELTGLDWMFSLMHYGEGWRKYRRTFASMFGRGNVHVFNPVQDIASQKLLERLLESPEEFEDHIRLHSGQLIMKTIYGIDVASCEDEYITVSERVMAAVSEVARPGAVLVDMFPVLKLVPSWIPGAFYQRLAKQLTKDVHEMREAPFAVAKSKMENGSLSTPSFVSELLEKTDGDRADVQNIVRDCSTVAYGAGSDTTIAALMSFFLAMTMYPEVQRKAQTELDAVLGLRLASFDDRKDLPYVNAIMRETLRWHTVAPQGLPHALKVDDVYNGFYLPAGSIIIGNTWGILHDPLIYPEPMEFKPERYFDSEGRPNNSAIDPVKFSFGYGRRICAGHHYAENTLFLNIARVLSIFNLSRGKGASGDLISVHLNATSGVVSHPSHFKCSIVPRSEETASLIRDMRP